jgi:nitrogen regulatory protein PII 1
MKCIKAIIRPEKEAPVIEALESAGISALTKWDVLGRGRQRGIQVGGSVYGELPKLCLMLVVEEEQFSTAVNTIMETAQTGNPGDGRIFVSEVQAGYTIRTGRNDSE